MSGVAVDDTSDDIYVSNGRAEGKGGVVDVFSSTGQYLSQLTGTCPAPGSCTAGEVIPFHGPAGLTINQATHDLYVTDPARGDGGQSVVDVFNGSGTYVSTFGAGTLGEVAGESIAINDLTDNAYVGNGNSPGQAVYVFSPAGSFLPPNWTGASSPLTNFDGEIVSVATDPSTGHVYVSSEANDLVDEFSDSTTEQYIGNVSGTASSGPLAYVHAVAVSPTNGNVYVAQDLRGVIDIFGPDIVYAAEISQSFSAVSLHATTLNAEVNGGAGVSTSYHFEYGLTTAYDSSTPQATGEGKFSASARLEGLQPETEYHFRIVATNADGTSYGPDTTFRTQTNQIGLPDGRGFEMVSPVDNADGNVFEPGVGGTITAGQHTGLPMRAAADGEALEYVAAPPAVGGNGNEGNEHGNEYVATRAAGGGWSALDLETPGLEKAPFEALFTDELSNSGAGGAPAGGERLSRGSYLLLEGDGQLERELREGAEPELQEKKQLEAEAAKLEAEAAKLQGIEKQNRTESAAVRRYEAKEIPREGTLYESAGGRLGLVAVLPDGELAPHAEFGGGGFSHVISANGSKIFWTELELTARNYGEGKGGPTYAPKAVYVREDGTKTLQVSQGAAQFWTASPDGRYAFYTEGERLWRFDTEDGSRVELAGEGSGMLGVIGSNETGEDGSYLYFVANGVLGNGAAHGALTGTCKVNFTTRRTEGTCNMYVLHDGMTTFISVLEGPDLGNDGLGNGVLNVGLEKRVAGVSADGSAVVFESKASLTGYPNNGQPEVYVYDAVTGGLSCVSCNPTGAPPTNGSSVSLPVSFSGAFMHRLVSEGGGRVFFDSTEGLVAQDTNGKQDVYEWEREGEGGCEQRIPARPDGGCVYLLSGGTSGADSFLLDASASGNDVFIISRAQLTPQDQGETYEVYDARVGAVEALAPPACTGTGCQGLPSAPPPFATPASVTFNGVGNFPGGTDTNPSTAKPKPKTKLVKCAKAKKLSHGKCVKQEKRANPGSQTTARGASKRCAFHGSFPCWSWRRCWSCAL